MASGAFIATTTVYLSNLGWGGCHIVRVDCNKVCFSVKKGDVTLRLPPHSFEQARPVCLRLAEGCLQLLHVTFHRFESIFPCCASTNQPTNQAPAFDHFFSIFLRKLPRDAYGCHMPQKKSSCTRKEEVMPSDFNWKSKSSRLIQRPSMLFCPENFPLPNKPAKPRPKPQKPPFLPFDQIAHPTASPTSLLAMNP